MPLNVTLVILPIIVLSLALTLVWTFILFFGWLKFLTDSFPRKKIEGIKINPKVSIIIPARNESMVIKDLMSDIHNQKYTNYELIVACNNCTDEDQTYKIAKKLENIRTKVLKFETEIKGKGPALNHALKYATGELICVLDADNRINPDFLSKAIPYFVDEKITGIQTRYKVLNTKKGIIPKLIDLETLIYVECFQDFCNLFNINTYFGGTGMIIRKNIIDKIKWGDSLVEDYELSLKLIQKGHRIKSATDVTIYDEKPIYWDELIKQRKRWVAGEWKLITKFYRLVSKPLHYALLLAPLNLLFTSLVPIFYWFNLITTFNYFNYWYLPVKFWLPVFVFNLALITAIVLTKKARYLSLLPFYLFVFANHWVVVLFASFNVKGWSETKSTHYGVEAHA